MTVDIAWGIRSAVCANEFLDDYIDYVCFFGFNNKACRNMLLEGFCFIKFIFNNRHASFVFAWVSLSTCCRLLIMLLGLLIQKCVSKDLKHSLFSKSLCFYWQNLVASFPVPNDMHIASARYMKTRYVSTLKHITSVLWYSTEAVDHSK